MGMPVGIYFSENDDSYLWCYDGSQIYFDDPAVDTPWGSDVSGRLIRTLVDEELPR